MASRDRFCWHCGSGLWANDEFCRTCGEDLAKRVPLGQERGVEPEPTSKVEPEVPSKVEPEPTSKVEPEVTQPQIPTGTTDDPNTNYLTGFKKGLYTLGGFVGGMIAVLAVLMIASTLLRNTDGVWQGNYWGVMSVVGSLIFGGIGFSIARFCWSRNSGKALGRIRHSHTDVSAPVTTRWYSRESISKTLTFIKYNLIERPWLIPVAAAVAFVVLIPVIITANAGGGGTEKGKINTDLLRGTSTNNASPTATASANLVKQYLNKGHEYSELGEWQKAIEQYGKVIRVDPEYEGGYFWRGFAYINLDEYRRAIKDYDEAIRLAPENPVVYVNRGYAYTRLGEIHRGIEDYDEAIRLAPLFGMAYYYRGLTYRQIGELDKGQRDSAKAKELGYSP